MKRKITLISLVLVLVMLVTCTLFACNFNEDTTYKKNHAKKLSDDSGLIGIFEGSEEIKNNLASSQYVLNENGGSEQEVYERENDYIYVGSYPQRFFRKYEGLQSGKIQGFSSVFRNRAIPPERYSECNSSEIRIHCAGFVPALRRECFPAPRDRPHRRRWPFRCRK